MVIRNFRKNETVDKYSLPFLVKYSAAFSHRECNTGGKMVVSPGAEPVSTRVASTAKGGYGRPTSGGTRGMPINAKP